MSEKRTREEEDGDGSRKRRSRFSEKPGLTMPGGMPAMAMMAGGGLGIPGAMMGGIPGALPPSSQPPTRMVRVRPSSRGACVVCECACVVCAR